MEEEQARDPKADARARREAENSRILEEKKAEFDGRVRGFPVGKHGILIVKFADRQRIKFFNKKVDALTKSVAKDALPDPDAMELLNEQLAIDCAVHPTDQATIKAIFNDYPYLIGKAAFEVIQLSGVEVEPLGKD